jgi:phosphatidylglycerophosphatase A
MSQGVPVRALPLSAPFVSVANFFALGFGSGLAPKAPGTFGTLLGVAIFLITPASLTLYIAAVAGMFCLGVWCCHRCAIQLGVHDHPAIVWDEVVGYLIVMISVPRTLSWIVAGFVIFRFFDIIKPWPIGWVDRHIHGGLGIMLDDVLAAAYSAIVMQLLIVLLA